MPAALLDREISAMTRQTHMPVAVVFWLAIITSSAADAQVALVEDVNSKAAGVEFMDYLPVGKQIRLGRQDTLVLSYLKSCWQESITGGTVTVGAEQSDVAGGKVERRKVDCDAGKLQLTAQQAGQSAGMVVRDLKPPVDPPPQITLFGSSPIVEIKGGGSLLIERLDQPGERVEITVAGPALLKGRFYDLARAGKSLAPGGTYRASAGGRQIVFKVDPSAKAGASPMIGRLLRIAPAA
jgi:hypothetical protein